VEENDPRHEDPTGATSALMKWQINGTMPLKFQLDPGLSGP
jgi:hypothetical protein